MFFQFVLVAGFFTLVLPQGVYAYLDPGTGSLFVQVLIGAVLGSLYFIKTYWNRIAKFIISLFNKNSDESKKTKQQK
jgi:hypothetical protein